MTLRRIGHGLAIAAALLALASEARAAEEVRDANGRLVQSVGDDGVVVVYVYDQAGNLVQARYSDGRVVDYDANGQPRSSGP